MGDSYIYALIRWGEDRRCCTVEFGWLVVLNDMSSYSHVLSRLFLTKLSNMERSLSRVCSGGTIQMTVSLFLLEFHQWKERRCGDWVTVAKVGKQLRTASSDE